jgi:hypothetical protein
MSVEQTRYPDLRSWGQPNDLLVWRPRGPERHPCGRQFRRWRGCGDGSGRLSLPAPRRRASGNRRYFRGSAGAARLSVVGQLFSAASLAWFTASVASLATRSGRGSRGLQVAALAGGGLAATSLATSALLSAVLTGRQGEQDASASALHRLVFAAGGPVHGAGFGVLVGSLGLVGLRTGELPRPLALAGLASAAAVRGREILGSTQSSGSRTRSDPHSR